MTTALSTIVAALQLPFVGRCAERVLLRDRPVWAASGISVDEIETQRENSAAAPSRGLGGPLKGRENASIAKSGPAPPLAWLFPGLSSIRRDRCARRRHTRRGYSPGIRVDI